MMRSLKFIKTGFRMKKKRFVLSGYFGFKNFGDEAILSVLVAKLREYGHKITVISSDTKYTKSKFRFVRSVYTFNIRDLIGAIAKSDFVISGGGSLLQDTTSFKSLIYYLFVIFMGLILGKKVIIFAQGIGPISNPFGKFLTGFLLKFCTYVSVRDAKSQELLKKWNVNSELLCDPIFSTVIPEIPKEKRVAVQLRNCAMMNEDFIDRLAQSVVTNFPDYMIDIYSFQDLLDLEVCKKFEHAVKLLNSDTKTTIFSGLTDEETVNNITKSEFMVAMRFHALIVGLLSKVKVLGINYDIKVEKLAKEFGFPLVGLKKSFTNEFSTVKNLDMQAIEHLVKNKNFDWSSFEHVING